MKKAFTLIELLVVIAIIAILAAMLLPALERARQSARRAACQSNMHNVGLAVETFRVDHGNLWDYGPCNVFMNYAGCQLMDLAMGQGYFEDPEVLICPNLDTPYPRNPHNHYGPADATPEPANTRDEATEGNCHQPQPDGAWVDTWGIEEISYFLDEYRISQTSDARRAILADGIEMVTEYGPEPANHDDGSTVVFYDQAVQWVPKIRPAERWLKQDHTIDYTYDVYTSQACAENPCNPDNKPGPSSTSTDPIRVKEFSAGGSWPTGWEFMAPTPSEEVAEVINKLDDLGYPVADWLDGTMPYGAEGDADGTMWASTGPWVRYGYIPNPRMDEDGQEGELDDVYELEGYPPPKDGPIVEPCGDLSPVDTDADDVTDTWGCVEMEYGIDEVMEAPNSFYAWAVFMRCESMKGFGEVSETDAAIAGGCIMEPWFDGSMAKVPSQGNGWRGARGAGVGDPDFESFYDTPNGVGCQGLDWGIPAQIEGMIY
jgi:prepilin-type N-terminal cleavage/methylation domain-containing protein